MPGVGWVVALVAALAVLAVVDRLLRAAEDRGWIRYRTSGVSRTSVGNAMMTVAAIWDPAAQHVVDERLEYDADEAGDDDPLDPPASRGPVGPPAP